MSLHYGNEGKELALCCVASTTSRASAATLKGIPAFLAFALRAWRGKGEGQCGDAISFG